MALALCHAPEGNAKPRPVGNRDSVTEAARGLKAAFVRRQNRAATAQTIRKEIATPRIETASTQRIRPSVTPPLASVVDFTGA